MKTTDFSSKLTSKQLQENISKQFGKIVKLEDYSREQLEDIRNKFRTKMFHYENAAGFNDLLSNENYQRDKAMLDLINTRIKEMLGEDIKKLRDKLAHLEEAKKGVRAPKHTVKAKGTDQDGDGKPGEFDDVQVARMTAGGVPKKKAIAKATSDKFEEGWDDMLAAAGKKQPSGGSGIKRGRYGTEFDPSKDEPSSVPNSPSRQAPQADDDLPKITSTEPGRYGDPHSTHMMAVRKVGKGSGEKISPEERVERRMAMQYLELLSDGEPVTDDEIQDVVDTMRASDDYRARVMKRVKGTSETMEGKNYTINGRKVTKAQYEKEMAKAGKEVKEAKDKCNHTPKGKKCPVHGLEECGGMEEAAEKPSAGLSKKERSAVVKKAQAGGDIGKKGKGFKDVEAAAKKGGAKDPKAVAAAAMWKQQAKKESQEIFRRHVGIINESLAFLIQENEEEKAKAITAAGDIVNDYTSWMQRVGQYQTKAMVELADQIRADFGPAESETFKQSVGPALQATLEVLMAQREAISNAVAVLAGEQMPTTPMGQEAGPPEPAVTAAAPDMMNEPEGDEFAAADAAAGGAETAGREMRESKFAKKLAESHSIMSKLAR